MRQHYDYIRIHFFILLKKGFFDLLSAIRIKLGHSFLQVFVSDFHFRFCHV